VALDTTWIAAGLTAAILAFYEVLLVVMQLRHPSLVARSAHASLREEWFASISDQRGSEILAVQTLRNSMMSATMLASTAALGLMGTVTLATPSLHASFGQAGPYALTPRLALELALLGLLFTSLVSTVMAVRFYNHASFICAIPVASPARQRWSAAGAEYVRRAGLLYSVGLRHLVLVMPVVAAILLPEAGPVGAVLVIAVLLSFDRAGRPSGALQA
jgi:hypothetical protein